MKRQSGLTLRSRDKTTLILRPLLGTFGASSGRWTSFLHQLSFRLSFPRQVFSADLRSLRYWRKEDESLGRDEILCLSIIFFL